MRIIEIKNHDLPMELYDVFRKSGYVCVDTETTGLSYLEDKLCTIQLYAENCAVLIQYDKFVHYEYLKQLFLSKEVVKIFHNAVFDVSFLMKNLELNSFGDIICTRIAAKLVHGLQHNNSLKPLLKEYLDVEITKKEQLSDWSIEKLSDEQKEYAINDVIYLKKLWDCLHQELILMDEEKLALDCFGFVAKYKMLTDKGIENIFTY